MAAKKTGPKNNSDGIGGTGISELHPALIAELITRCTTDGVLITRNAAARIIVSVINSSVTSMFGQAPVDQLPNAKYIRRIAAGVWKDRKAIITGDTSEIDSTDAKEWATAFARVRLATLSKGKGDIADDPITMMSWMANAIEAGRTAGLKAAHTAVVGDERLEDSPEPVS